MTSELYLKDLAAKLYEFQREDILCDTLLIADDCRVWAHSVILAAASPHIYKNFLSVTGHKTRSRFSIKLAGCTSVCVKAILHFLYTGSLVLPPSFQQPDQFNGIVLVCERMGIDVAKLNGIAVIFDNFYSIETTGGSQLNEANHGEAKLDFCIETEEQRTATDEELLAVGIEEITSAQTETSASDVQLVKNALDQVGDCLKLETLQELDMENNSKEDCNASELPLAPGEFSHIMFRNLPNTGADTCISDQKVKIYLKIRRDNTIRHAVKILQKHTKKFRPISQWYMDKNRNGRQMSEINNCLRKSQSSIVTGCTEPEFTCNICNKKFLSAKQLQSHENWHAGDRPHVCSTCGRTYRYRSSLMQHSQMHVEKRPYLCDVCGRGFALAVNLRRHTLSRHSNERPFECKECGRGFVRDYLLRQHMENHTGNRSNVCYLCGKSFSHRGNLNRHVNNHTGEKRHVCNVCGKAFNRKSNMEKHVLLHSKCSSWQTRQKELPQFDCLECRKVFRTEKLLMRHELIHSGDQAIVCDICLKTFTTVRYLHQHKVIHQDKQFRCNFCSKMFASEQFLSTHITKYHASPDRVYNE